MISDGDDFGNENGILMANLNDEDSRYNIVQRRKECVFSKTQVVTIQCIKIILIIFLAFIIDIG